MHTYFARQKETKLKLQKKIIHKTVQRSHK
jgi:hypothetical protein